MSQPLSRAATNLCLALTLACLGMVGASTAQAGDRHVYLDTDGDGQLNDCPNPSHNLKGTSNTDELLRCTDVSPSRFYCSGAGCQFWTRDCAAGSRASVVTGDVVDVDGDGQGEPVYGHPQACVYNMAKSDSCEVHAGVYSRPGAYCDENCGEGVASAGSCQKPNCFLATVVAYGQGPNLGSDGYGTAQNPGYFRGAVLNGSIDTWDSNGNKIPDTEPGEPTSYPAVFSGDLNGDGAFDTTNCSGGSCSGDAYLAVAVGCGGPSGYGGAFCSSSFSPGRTWTRIDANGDGVMDTNYGTRAWNASETHHLIIRDIEMRHYNGGNGHSGGARIREGIIALEGNDGSTDGLKVEHVYVHSNDYSVQGGSSEMHWAMFSDSHNSFCADVTEIKDSYLVQTNEKLYDNDCGPGTACGCPLSLHDNRIHLNVTSPRKRSNFNVFFYLKSINFTHNIYNNEFVLQSTADKFWDVQEFGDDNLTPNNTGRIRFYGNIVRDLSPSLQSLTKRFGPYFCTGTAGGLYTLEMFNNTFDSPLDLDLFCSESGRKFVSRNNAYFRSRGVHNETATTRSIAADYCSTSTDNPTCTIPPLTGRTDWFTLGLSSPGVHGGLENYVPVASGPLASAGNCDPDGDGINGVDYDGDGINDTAWLDIAGNQVTCESGGAIHVGAVQSSTAAGSPPNAPMVSVGDVTTLQAVLTGSAFGDPDAGDTHAASNFQVATETGGFTGPGVVDSGVLNGAVTQWTATGLLPGTAYLARARYRDSTGLWSSWSAGDAAPFTTLVDTTPPGDVQNLRRTDTD